jgi:hypothetical protein
MGRKHLLILTAASGMVLLNCLPAQGSGPGEGIGQLIVLGLLLLVVGIVSHPIKWLAGYLIWKKRIPPILLIINGITEIIILLICFLFSAIIGGPKASHFAFISTALAFYMPSVIFANIRLQKHISADQGKSSAAISLSETVLLSALLPILFLSVAIPLERHNQNVKDQHKREIIQRPILKYAPQPEIIKIIPAPRTEPTPIVVPRQDEP